MYEFLAYQAREFHSTAKEEAERKVLKLAVCDDCPCRHVAMETIHESLTEVTIDCKVRRSEINHQKLVPLFHRPRDGDIGDVY